MSFLRGIARTLMQAAADATRVLRDGADRLMKAGMLDRAAAVVALVAYWPDKNASQPEIRKGINAIFDLTNGAFDKRTMEGKIMAAIDKLQKSGGDDIAYAALLRELGGVVDEGDRQFLVNMAIAVGKADGKPGEDPFSLPEKDVVRDICRALKLNPSEFGL